MTGIAVSASVRERWRMGVDARALLLLTAVLLAFGLVTVYSASSVVAVQADKPNWYYFVRQLSGVAAGILVFMVAAKTDAERWAKWAWPIMGASLFMLLLVVLPFTTAIAPRILGSRRFLFGASLQPSELGKLAVIVWTAMLIVRKGDKMRRLTKGLLPFLVVVGIMDILVAVEPDLSTAMLYTLVMAVILFGGGARIGHFIALGVLAIPLMWHEMERLQYVALRMASFLDPGQATARVSYQLQQSLIAVGSGRWFGVGFGSGHQQYGFLPEPFSDFIASTIGEEWGFLGMLALIAAYAGYAWLGLRIARNARTEFQKLVALGLTFTMVLTAYLHIGVVVGLLPTTGLTLPFVSYGRSNLVLSLLMTGMLVNIGSTKEKVVGDRATDPLALAGA